MAAHDARVQEIEVLHHFASAISRVGGNIVASASRLEGAVYQERSEFRSLLDTLESHLESAQADYAYALSEWEDEQDTYTEQALDAARERLNTAQEAYEEGVEIYQQVETLLMNAISFAGSFGPSIQSRTDRASANVQLAATRLQEYLTH